MLCEITGNFKDPIPNVCECDSGRFASEVGSSL